MENYFIIRGTNSGVFAGEIESRNGVEVTMINVRRLWYWDGAASICELAKNGTKKPQNCKFTVVVDRIIILDACEIEECTEKAEKSIKGVKEWIA